MDEEEITRLYRDGLLSKKDLALLRGDYVIKKSEGETGVKFSSAKKFSIKEEKFSIKEVSKKEFEELKNLLAT